MSAPKPVLNLDDLSVDTVEIVPAAALEDLDEGHAITELGASCCPPPSFDSCMFVPDADEAP